MILSASAAEREVPPKVYVPLTTTQIKLLICAYCFQTSKSLQKCSGCRRVAYCGAQCQNMDWKLVHKRQCPSLQQCNAQDSALGLTTLQLQRYIVYSQMKVETFPALNSMYINHEITCVACYRTEFQWSPSITFDSCPSCKLVHWCPDHAKSDSKSTWHTPEDCAELKNLFSAERVLIDYALARKSARKIIIHSEPRRSHIPFIQLTGWKDYLRRIHPTLGELLKPMTDEIGGSHPNRATARDALQRVVLEGTSFVATVMYGLEVAFPDVAQRGNLTIHFVGAASYEIDGLGLMEELLHHLPKLKLLKLHYVGPEISPNAILDYTDPTRNWACPHCQAKGRKRFNVLSTLPYHDYILQSSSAAKPDLVVGLNTGFSEVDVGPWTKSVKAILRLGVPALFTAYQKEEALMERKMLQRIGGVEFVLPAEENKWRGTIPNVNNMQKLVTGKSLGLSHKNQFLYIVKGVQ